MRKLLTALFCAVLAVAQLAAQTRTIKGKVTDDKNAPLVNASVVVKGATVGTTTDPEGNFSINVPASARTLVISSLNFETQEVSIANRTTVNVALVSSLSNLQEVVVVGYGGAKKKAEVSGSFTTVNATTVQDKPVANLLDALQGKAPGLQVFTSSGEPSASSSIRINGVGSLGASSTPLFILDGIPTAQGTIISMNPEDFESITILRDASATSIYGSRAANGVIVMTTKKGSAFTSRINLEVQYGVSNLTNNTTKLLNSVMNTAELQAFQLETGQFTQAQINQRIANGYTHNTRWADVYYKENAPTTQVNLNFSGGGGKTTYFISGGYFEQDGLAWRSKYKRYTLRSNLTTTVNNWFQMGLNLFAGYDERQTNQYGSNSLNRGLMPLLQPYYSPNDANGNPVWDALIPGLGLYHPKYLAEKNPGMGSNVQFNPTAYLQITPIQGLTIKTQAGMDGYVYTTEAMRLPSNVASPNNGAATMTYDRGTTFTVTNTAEYSKRVANDHYFSVLGGQEFIKDNSNGISAGVSGLTDDRLLMLSNGSASTYTASSSRSEYSFLSYFGRLNYNYKSKYFVDFTARYDQSSRFGKDLKGADFYSGGIMWNAKKEDFLDNVNWLTDLRVKASYGTSGNSGIGNYQALALVGTGNYGGQPTFGASSAGNPLLSWESKRQFNIGFEAKLWNRLTLEAEYFHAKTSSMLVSVPQPYTTGFTSATSNVGSLQNTGVNAMATYDIINKRGATLSIYANAGLVNQKITELFDGRKYWIISGTGVSWAVGQPLTFLYPIFKGINPANGNPEWFRPFADPNLITSTNKNPNEITSTFNSAALQQNTGIKRYAPFNGGFGLNGSWKNFSINADFTYSLGKYLINNDQYFFENPNQFSGYNQSRNVLNYWKKAGDNALYPRYGIQFTQFDSRLIQNASFMRLKNLTVGYTIPREVLNKTKVMNSVRAYVTFRNLWTLTKYAGPDPEVDSNLSLGANPNTKQVVFGLSFGF